MKNLTNGNVFKNFMLFAIPLILSGLLSQSFNTVNTMIIGKILGESGMASSGSTGTFIEVISAIIWGLGTGVSIHIGALFGAGKLEKMINAIKVNMLLISALALAISMLVIVFHTPIFKILEIKEDISSDAFRYFAIYMAGFIFMSFNWCSVYILNALGNPTYPVIMSLLSSVLNIAGNILFIAVFKMGIAGAALSTLAVNAVTTVLYLFKFRSEFKQTGIAKTKLDFNKKEILSAWKLGIPCMIQQFVMYISSAGVQPVINSLGTAAIAGYAVCMRVYSINSVVFQSSSKCLSNYCAQCIGAGKIKLINKGVKISVIQAFCFVLPVMLCFMIFPKQIVSLFYNNPDGESALFVIRYIYLCVPFFIFQILNNMFHNFFRGVMSAKIALITTFIYSVVRIAASYALAPSYKMDGIYIALILAWITEAVISAVIFGGGKWKTKEYIEKESIEKNIK